MQTQPRQRGRDVSLITCRHMQFYYSFATYLTRVIMSVIIERAIRSTCFFFKEAQIHFPPVCLDSVFFQLLCFVFNVHFRFGEESQGSFFSDWVQLFGSAKTSIALFGLSTLLWLLWQMLQMLYDLNDQIYVCIVETLPIVIWWQTAGLNLHLDSQCFLSVCFKCDS